MPIADSEPPRIEQPAEPGVAANAADGTTRIELPVFAPPRERCADAAIGEIVVCATNPEEFRLRTPPGGYGPPPPRSGLSARLGEGVSVEQSLEQVTISGAPSNRVMAKVKIAF